MVVLWQQVDIAIIDICIHFFCFEGHIHEHCSVALLKKKSDVVIMTVIIVIIAYFGNEVLIDTYTSDQNDDSILCVMSFSKY